CRHRKKSLILLRYVSSILTGEEIAPRSHAPRGNPFLDALRPSVQQPASETSTAEGRSLKPTLRGATSSWILQGKTFRARGGPCACRDRCRWASWLLLLQVTQVLDLTRLECDAPEEGAALGDPALVRLTGNDAIDAESTVLVDFPVRLGGASFRVDGHDDPE